MSYDEFSMLVDNASEAGIPWDGQPKVERQEVVVDAVTGRAVSALVWGNGPADIVLVHGGAQNAHTWDTLALALGRPLVALDLPGHGHSGWREDHSSWPPDLADDLAVAVETFAPDSKLLVGMSLGGLTAISLAARYAHLVRRLAVVDVTPGTDHAKAAAIVAFVSGPERFASFEEILERTVAFNPTRSESSLRRGILHNAHELPDGQWSWRWDPARHFPESVGVAKGGEIRFNALWGEVSAVEAPITLYRGGISPVVGDEDVVEFLRRRPNADVVVVEGAGHSIQGDKPLELAELLRSLLD